MIIEASRLIIRPFVRDDLLVIHRILNKAFGDVSKAEYLLGKALEERRSWLEIGCGHATVQTHSIPGIREVTRGSENKGVSSVLFGI